MLTIIFQGLSMNTTYLLLLSGALIIIAALSWYAWHLTRQVKAMDARRLQEQAEAELQMHNKQLELVSDIRFIARAVLEEQCEITEGVLRLHYMISVLDPDSWEREELAGVRSHHQATRAMPILDAYKQLTPKERFRLDKERFALEETNKPTIQRELRWLVSYQFPAVTLIQ